MIISLYECQNAASRDSPTAGNITGLFHSRYFELLVGKAQVLLPPLMMALFY